MFYYLKSWVDYTLCKFYRLFKVSFCSILEWIHYLSVPALVTYLTSLETICVGECSKPICAYQLQVWQGTFTLMLLSLLFSCSVVSDSLWPHGLQHARNPCPSPTPGACSNSWQLSQWSHPRISFSVIPFSSSLQSFPPSGSFPVGRLFTSGGQRTGALVSASGLPMNVQDWFPLGLTGLISSQTQGLSRVFSSTTVQKH